MDLEMAAVVQQTQTPGDITANSQVAGRSPQDRSQVQQALADILGAMSHLLHLHAHPYTPLEEAEHPSTGTHQNDCAQ